MKQFLNLYARCYNFKIFKYFIKQSTVEKLLYSTAAKTNDKKLSLPEKKRNFLQTGPGLKEFLIVGKNKEQVFQLNSENNDKYNLESIISSSGYISTKNINGNINTSSSPPPYLNPDDYNGNERKVYFEIYGCQMNVNDTEIIWSILNKNNYKKCDDIKDADIILIITCAIRDGAEKKIWNRLKHLHAMKQKRKKTQPPLQIGVLGCMAERLKIKLLEKEKWVDIIAGPDSYKDLPRLLTITYKNHISAINCILSMDETYADITPIRLNNNSCTAYVSIMRGCDNMCTYCIVPFTRGKERSRSIKSIKDEVNILRENGIKEITLLGQNVNSYRDLSSTEEDIKMLASSSTPPNNSIVSGFKTVYKTKLGGLRFAELLQNIAELAPDIRIRFTSPHPKDFPDNVLSVISNYSNICKNLHLPAQSGNTDVLNRMRRGYTREAYINLVNHIRDIIPNVSLSSDFICGFCGETDAEFNDTLTLIELIKYNVAFLFAYSMRDKTTAYYRYKDDVQNDIKLKRLQQMVNVYRRNAEFLLSKYINQIELILIEGNSKRSNECLYGRNDGNIKVIIPNIHIPIGYGNKNENYLKNINIGDFIAVKITESNSQNLRGIPLYHSNLTEFYQ